MAQVSQGTPTVQANIGGSTTTVNLRDWLNTRLGPFLKKAIIESLDSEAEYPLQWLGEQLIAQSIEFEGNPDTTNIREHFLYKHKITSQSAPQESSPSTVTPTEVVLGQQHQVASQLPTSGVDGGHSEDTQEIADPSQKIATDPVQVEQPGLQTSTETNGLTSYVNTEAQPQDTEMSNAS